MAQILDIDTQHEFMKLFKQGVVEYIGLDKISDSIRI